MIDFMGKIDLYIAEKTYSLKDTMCVIDKNSAGFAVVCDEKTFIGIVTDGDIRRYLLKGGSLKENICNVTNRDPYYVDEENQHLAVPLMLRKELTAMPVVNKRHELVDIILNKPKEIREKEKLAIPLVIMAGGKGARLKPYTDILPKPLIPIDGITITEQIMNRFDEYGCKDVYVIVNYMKDFIKAYFNEKDLAQAVHFIEESQFLGTGGGLKYVKGIISGTFFVSNCDVLIDCDYAKLLAHHRAQNNVLTMVCAKKNLVIPYGTVTIDEDRRLSSMQEKPEIVYNINTGVYVVQPELLELIPENEPIHMTELIGLAMKKGEKIGTYVINESQWMDMGQMEELEEMKRKLERF